MKFLRDKKLLHLAGYILALAVIAFIAQYFIVRTKVRQLEEAQLKQEFTRIAQVSNQQIDLAMQDYFNGNATIAAGIASQLDLQDNRLNILSSGGRVEQTDEFITPLSRLARITFLNLKDDWTEYKTSILAILAGKINTSAQVQVVRSPDSLGDSTTSVINVSASESTTATTLQYKGLSLTMKSWYDKLMVDLGEEVGDRKASLDFWNKVLTVVNVGFAITLFGLFVLFVVKPLNLLKDNISKHQHTSEFPPNEIGEVAIKANHTIESLRDATDFVMAIGQGNLSISYKDSFDHNYTTGHNKLADSLIEMQNKLRELNEQEQKRQWANEGLARFVDIMRSSNDNLHDLGDKIISALVQYTKSNQGALYILNEEDGGNKTLDLISLFAFDTKKYESQQIKPGQGILGQTFLEKETTYLTDLPDDYVRITSGLGGARPKCILIVPLKLDTEVYGLVELASFNEMSQHEIAFVEKLGETIASSLGSVRAAHKQTLLIEQFQLQTEQMKAQEEEMRQSMEELQATQEEVVRKERTYISRIEELEQQLKQQNGKEALEQLQNSFIEKEKAYQEQLESLRKLVEEKSVPTDQWAVVEELEKTLRVNLEAIRISQDELDRKRKA